MFEREHHLRIASILLSLDHNILAQNKCYFGGGTAIVLSHSEYRESADIDFLISDSEGYRHLRELVKGPSGIKALMNKNTNDPIASEVRMDQYGIRTMLKIAGAEIKFEIVFEGRIKLEEPSKKNRICGIATLTKLDMATSKLLANSDRWMDNSVFSRDLIDLAMLEPSRSLLIRAIKKAAEAYGQSIERDLSKAIRRFAQQPQLIDECRHALKIDQISSAVLWSKIRRLEIKK